MKKQNLFALLIILFVFAACKKDSEPDLIATVSKTTELQVPQNFNWKTTRDLTLNVVSQGSQLFDVISVYTSNPYNGDKAFIKGSAKTGLPFNTTISIPTTVTELYVVKTSADGSTDMQKVSALQQTINVVFSKTKSSSPKSIPYQTNNGPGTSANVIITQTSGTITITGGQTYIMNNNFTGNINWEPWNNGGTLKINNNVTFTSGELGNNCKIQVLPNAKLTVNNTIQMYGTSSMYVYTNGEAIIDIMKSNQSSVQYVNYGSFKVTTWSGAINGSIENYAYFKTTQNTTTSTSASITNYGDLIFDNNFETNKPLINYNTLHVKGNFIANGINLENQCKILVDNNMSINATSLISEPATGTSIIVGNKFFGSSSALVKLRDGSLLLTKDMEYYGTIQGDGNNTSSVKVTGSFVNMWGSTIKSKIEISGTSSTAPAGMTLQGGQATYTSNAAATNFIPASECNPGIGFVAIVDADNDGVADAQDDYPNDATKAYNNYYPGANTYGTIMFEDLWPAMGDYDFNDMVVNYKVNQITNAANKAVEINASYKIKAVGGTISNGFGIQFDGLNPNQIQLVTGTQLSSGSAVSVANNGVENGQNKAVVILYDKTSHLISQSGSFVNTEINKPRINAYTFNVVIKFTSAIDPSLLGTAPYNYFMFRTTNRGHEVHAKNNQPTSLANLQTLGTVNDASNPATSQYYKTATNLPWAISVPVEIDYPSEKNDIVTAFTYFASWAQSGGVTKSDWYSDMSGYRNNSLIYHYNASPVK
jgi:LruC domain-containing protein